MKQIKDYETMITKKFSIDNNTYDVHVTLLGNEDGGGQYRRYDYTWLWITLITTVILVVILVIAYSGDWWYYQKPVFSNSDLVITL